jgi:fibronectin type 3 domain-containing protein
VSGLTSGQTYYFEVVAVNGALTSPPSNEMQATVLPAAPTLQMPTAGNGSVTLTWTASNGATSYSVYEGTSPGGEGATAAVTVNGATTTPISPLTNGQTYYFKVAAVDAAGGASALSNEVSATPSAPPPPSGQSGGGGGALGMVDLLAAALIASAGLWRRARREAVRS